MRWSWASGRTRAGSRRKKSSVWPRCGGSTSDRVKRPANSTGAVMPLRRSIVLSLLVVASTSSVATAQRMLGPDPNRDPRFGVYVRDSAVASEKLALAERMERLKEWDKSADVYQEIVEK